MRDPQDHSQLHTVYLGGNRYMFEIVSKTKLADKVWRMDVVAPLVAGKAMPGQFLIIRVDKDGERIPLTVCDFDREKGIVTIVFQTVGAETERMSRVEVGECFADVVGPLGRPSDLCDLPIEEQKKKKILFIAGGVGTAPVYNQLQWLHENGVDVDCIQGARTKDLLILEDNGSLIVAVALVASYKLAQMIFINTAFIIGDTDVVGFGPFHRSAVLCHYAHAGVDCRLHFHTGTYYRCFRGHKRNGLTLHVGTHQSAVGVVILQERNQGCSHREYHLGRHIHVIDPGTLIGLRFLTVTSGNVLVQEMAFLIKRRICLRNMVIVLGVRSHIYNVFRYPGIHRIGFIHHTVRSLYETIFIDSRIACQRVDQADIGTFRRLDRAHSAIVGIMYVSYLKTCTVSGKTAGTKGGQTAFMRQFTQRIVLIHEL